MASSQTVWGDTGVSAVNIGSIPLSGANNGRVDDGSCASGTYISGGNVGLRIQIIDPTMPNNPTCMLAKVEMRLNEASSGSASSNIKIRRSGQSNCAGHSLKGGQYGASCGATAWSGWVTCTHSQRPRTIAEAKGTVTIEWLKPVSGTLDNSNHDGVEVRYTYEIWGTPATPSVAGYERGKLRITKGASPTGATHWQIWRSNNGSTGWIQITQPYMSVGTTTYDDTTGHGDGVTRYYRIRYSASGDGDFSNYSNNGSATTWDVPSAPGNCTFSARTTTQITLNWTASSTGGDPGGIDEYHYQWKINGGGYAHVDTNSTGLSTTHGDGETNLSAGSRYWFEVHAVNAVGDGGWNTEQSHWTLCSTPSAPTVTANAVGSLRIQHADVTGIDKWRVMRSATSGGSYSQVYLSGAGATALDWSDDGEGDGVTWYYKLYARNIDGNDSGLGTYTSGITWNVPSTSADPTLNADGVGDITGTKPSSPANNGSTITQWQYQVDNDSGFGSLDYESGDIAIGTPTHQATGLSNGVVYYAQVRFKNAVGYSAAWSVGSVNETTWDVPDAQDLVSASNAIEDSMIQITRNGSYPNGNGDAVDSWDIWRSATSGSGYSELITGLTTTTYNDWSVNGDETWYYKALFTNLVGDSALSTNPVNATAIEADITMFSNTWVRIPFFRVSDSIIKVTRITKGIPQSGLMAHYPLDYDSNDVSGNNRHSTTENNIIYDTGFVNNAAYFNATNSKFIIPNTVINESEGSVSINFFPNNTAAVYDWILSCVENDLQLQIVLMDDDTLGAYWGDGDNVIQTSTCNIGEWNNVTITWDSTNFYLYLNAIYQDSALTEGITIGSNDITIGDYVDQYPFDGRIDELLFYDRKITPTEMDYFIISETPSDTRIRDTYEISIADDPSDLVRIKVIDNELTSSSDTTVERIREISRVSNTKIFSSGRETTTISDSAIHREGFNDIQILSIADIKRTFKSTTVSNTRIKAVRTHRSLPKTDLITWYPLDYNANDFSGNDYHGINNGAEFITGEIINAALFDGVSESDYITVPNFNANTIFTDGKYSYACWFRWDGNGGGADGRRFILETAPTWALSCWVNSGATPKFVAVTYTNEGGEMLVMGDTTIIVGVTYFVVVTVELGIANGIKIYINGELDGEGSDLQSPTNFASSTDLRIGTYRSIDNRWFDGFIDDLQIYSRIITQEEIQSLFSTGISSVSTIFHSSWGDKQLSSNERIVKEGTIVIPPVYSDIRIKNIGIEVLSSEPTWNEFRSDTFIKLVKEVVHDPLGAADPITSDTAIFNAGYGNIQTLSDTAIFRVSYDIKTKLSDTIIYKGDFELTKFSDIRIFRPSGYLYPLQQQLKVADTRIKNTIQLDIGSKSYVTLLSEFSKLSNTLIIHTPDIIKLSNTLIIDFIDITKVSNTWIQIPDNNILIVADTTIVKLKEITILSDSNIKESGRSVTKLSDTLIYKEPTINIFSDSRIKILSEINNKISDTYIINEGTKIVKNSDSAIFNASYEIIEKESRVVIKILAQKSIELSDSSIQRTFSIIKLSNVSIRRNRSSLKIIFQKSRQL